MTGLIIESFSASHARRISLGYERPLNHVAAWKYAVTSDSLKSLELAAYEQNRALKNAASH
ncbi:hypothetical protein [Collimonas sp. PA-H2]|uniref:hypothetical protein n=1 Tax=Collimonas sp. PA-H2 TaxID=1881062 RepID=UPI00117EE327|nr:hypothetical protein [Collimonas sp. PA-H2]